MKPVFKNIILYVLSLTAFSCSESKLLQKGLSQYSEHLGYEFTSPISKGPKADSLVVIFNGRPLDSLTTAKRERTLILPFIFVNYYNFKYRVNLGASSLDQDYNDFFFNALLDESDRSGHFALSYDSLPSDSTYTLEITLDTCEATCVFEKTNWSIFYVYGYAMSYEEFVKPTQCKLSCSAILRKGKDVISDKRFVSTKKRSFPGGSNMNRSDMYPLLSSNLVETLCLCTKDCITEIVVDVNKSLSEKK